MNDEIFQRIKNFLAEGGLDFILLERTTKLERDLGIYGDDAVEFLIAYSKRFNVDVSQFMTASYFSGEGFDFVRPLIRLFTGKFCFADRKNLTISDLERGVIAGRLDEEVINYGKIICNPDKSKIYKDVTLSYRPPGL